MPIFEYQCKACKAEFEKLIFAKDKEPVCCPDCRSTQVQKKMSAATLPTGGGGCGTASPGPFR